MDEIEFGREESSSVGTTLIAIKSIGGGYEWGDFLEDLEREKKEARQSGVSDLGQYTSGDFLIRGSWKRGSVFQVRFL